MYRDPATTNSIIWVSRKAFSSWCFRLVHCMEGLPLQGQAEQEGDEHFMGCEWKLSFYTL